jgi:hypothetical protein
MKYCFATIFLFIVFCHSLAAQTGNSGPGRPPQAVYVNAGGASPLFSIHYDRRFKKQYHGAGFTVGAGYYGGIGSPVLSAPVALNYLLGKKNHFVEFAVGTTWMNEHDDFFDTHKDGSGFLWNLGAGYRFQPRLGFFGRSGIAAIWGGKNFDFTAYIGLGVAF